MPDTKETERLSSLELHTLQRLVGRARLNLERAIGLFDDVEDQIRYDLNLASAGARSAQHHILDRIEKKEGADA